MHHVIIMGTRPEIIKLSPLIKELINRKERFTLIDSGQHYDHEMSKVFYEDLQLPKPNYKLDIPKDKPNKQIGFIFENLLEILPQINPDIVYAQGDTNTVMITALACQRLFIPLGHVEAGLRSYDMTMPEEANRRIASICAAINFCPTPLSAENLLKEGIKKDRIIVTGNTIVDAVINYFNSNQPSSNLLKKLNITKEEQFLVLTLHRPSNVDDRQILEKLLKSFIKIPRKILFFIHPRTAKKIEEFELNSLIKNKNVFLHPPIGYFNFLTVIRESEGIITDSGGIQEESVTLKIPCITLRPNTERPEAILAGINSIINPNSEDFENTLISEINNFDNKLLKLKLEKNPFGDGKASKIIIDTVKSLQKSNKLKIKIPIHHNTNL